jgi:YYY domain-containing protein
MIAALLRLHDLNWDQSQYNHPDERHVTNVISALNLPASVGEYFDSGRSPLNPYNLQASWVYGTLPLFSGRLMAEFLNQGCAPTNALVPQMLGQAIFGADVANCREGFFTGYEYIRLVGRFLSALADLVTVLLVYLTGRRLFGWRVGLLAMAFSALAVLQIQHSKFFVVEALLTMCVAACLYFCARVATTQVASRRDVLGLWANAAAAGLFSGLAVACKISAWPTAALVVVAVAIALLRDRRVAGPAIVSAVIATFIAGTLAFAGFRVAQPYGFVGASEIEWRYTTQQCADGLDPEQAEICARTPPMPERVQEIVTRLPAFIRPILAPSSRWVAELQNAAASASGDYDPPFGWQWANRMPIVFPLVNLVFYGLGLPLGIAAVAGAFYMLTRLLRGRRWWAYLIPTLWVFGFFLYQSTQFVKSIRYLLPIYPMLCVCAAVVLVALWRRANAEKPLLRFGAPALISVVLAGTLAWTLAFMRIYDGEMTRTEASRWIYTNVPTALTLTGDANGRRTQVQLPVPEVALQPNEPYAISLRLGEDVDAAVTDPQLALNHVEGEGEVFARLLELNTQVELANTRQRISPNASTLAFDSVTLDPNVDYMVELTLDGTASQSIRARTSVIANQHWDEGVPFRIDGKDGFGSYYRGLRSTSDGQMQVYNEEDPFIDAANPGKLGMLLNGLDEADYLVLNSNRHYGSVARLPWRFPMTNEYFRALMGGELGFELVADFYRFPQIGPFIFNDQEMPQKLARPANVQGTPLGIEVPYPSAEEAFSVYDHPRVLIFKKTNAYSRERAQSILSPFDAGRTIRQTAFQASNTPHGLLLDDKTLAAQQAGGTWAELFPRNSPLNQSQPLAVVAWVALLKALGVAGFLLLASATVRIRQGIHATLLDGGFAFAKILGMLLVAFAAWWLASVQAAQFTPLLIWALIGALAVAAAVVGHLNRDHIIALVRGRWPALLAGEVVFLVAFVFFLLVRAGNPDLWHPYMGGEKPMDFAYFNSVLKATYFPPQDPWFAGGYINYYYFGFVLVGTLVKALGIDPAVAYNIVIPTLFALTACGAFGLAATFYASRRITTENTESTEESHAQSDLSVPSVTSVVNLKRAIVAGVIAAVFAVGIGNGDQISVVGPAWQQLGGIDQGTPAPLALVNGFVKWLGGAQLPIAPNWPYWNPTRLASQAEEAQIAEFPQFTFLYADLHAHMMAMPLAFLALAFALAYAGGARKWWAVVMGAIAVGMLWPTNTWDYPPYLLLALCGLALGAMANRTGDAPLTPRTALSVVASALPAIIAFAVLSRAVMIPYLANYGSAYNSIERWNGGRIQLDTFISVYGLFLIPLAALLVWNAFAGPKDDVRLTRIALGIGAVAGVALLLLGVPVAIIAAPMVLLSLAAAFLTSESTQSRLLWLMTAGAWVLTLFVEVFTLQGDIGRMNTVFKFYIQAWLLLSVASAVALVWVVEQLFARSPRTADARQPTANNQLGQVLRGGFTFALAVAFFLAALYPAFAIPAKIEDRYVKTAPRGLDGMAFMQSAMHQGFCANEESQFSLSYDYDAIKWMQDNVVGSPTVMEGTTGGNLYCWGNRYSIYTGLPAVIGWQWHQRQQRAALQDDRIVYDRDADVAAFYSAPDVDYARTVLRRYKPGYIVVGPLERSQYGEDGLGKFDDMVESGDLRVAYQNPGVTIYEVLRPTPALP